MLSQIEYAGLVDRAKRNEPGAREGLLVELRRWWVPLMFKKFSHLSEGHAQMLENVELTVLRWLHENPDLVPEGQAPGILAWRLLAQTAKQWVRDRKHERQAIAGVRFDAAPTSRRVGQKGWAEAPAPADFAIAGSDAERLIRRLGEPHRATLIAELAHKLAGGPSLEEAFALSPLAARQRLSRARLALLASIQEGKEAES